MKTVFKISLALNLGLAAGLIFMWLRLEPNPAAFSQKIDARPSTTPVMISARPGVQAASPPAFRWHQLDDQDYHMYVKNLRTIGCPEATVRAIVSADVHAAYGLRSQELEKKLIDLGHDSWSALAGAIDSETKLKTELQHLPAAETASLADLLGLKPVADPLAAQPVVRVPPLTLPLALQPIDPLALNLKPAQLKIINEVRQDFIDGIGGSNQDPNDPAYLKRWQQAQPAADDTLQAMLGNDAYTQYQLAAYQMALENGGPAAK
jgi:hypothetical protein